MFAGHYQFGPLDANDTASTFCWVLFHTASTDYVNLLADRPAPRGAAGGAGGGPPCKSKNTTFKIFKKKATTTSHNVTTFEIL